MVRKTRKEHVKSSDLSGDKLLIVALLRSCFGGNDFKTALKEVKPIIRYFDLKLSPRYLVRRKFYPRKVELTAEAKLTELVPKESPNEDNLHF